MLWASRLNQPPSSVACSIRTNRPAGWRRLAAQVLARSGRFSRYRRKLFDGGQTTGDIFSMRLLRLRRLLLPVVSASLLALVVVQSAFADPRDFELKNNSSVDLAFAYVSP